MKLKMLSVLLLFFLFSCRNSHVYEKYIKIPDYIWNENQELKFKPTVKDTSVFYNVYFNIRNATVYPYSNTWVLIRKSDPSGNKIYEKSYEFILADQQGKWLGKGIGDIFDNRFLMEEKVKFSQPGLYQYSILQFMRSTNLAGVMDIGIEVEKAGK
jgi:gliding motility-associated lipoprotein GldH